MFSLLPPSLEVLINAFSLLQMTRRSEKAQDLPAGSLHVGLASWKGLSLYLEGWRSSSSPGAGAIEGRGAAWALLGFFFPKIPSLLGTERPPGCPSSSSSHTPVVGTHSKESESL